MKDLLKTPIGVICATVLALGLVGSVVTITIVGLSPASFIQNVITIAAVVPLVLGTEQVRKQTNGRMTELIAQINKLTEDKAKDAVKIGTLGAALPSEVAAPIIQSDPDPGTVATVSVTTATADGSESTQSVQDDDAPTMPEA